MKINLGPMLSGWAAFAISVSAIAQTPSPSPPATPTPSPTPMHSPAPTRQDVPRVLVIGDSQANNLVGGDQRPNATNPHYYDIRGYRAAFDRIGHLDKLHMGITYDEDLNEAYDTAVGGTRAYTWIQPTAPASGAGLPLLQNAVSSWPTVD